MFAVIKTGGKQYLVSPGDKIDIEKINKKDGEEVVFSEILLAEDKSKKLEIGTPLLKNVRVIGRVLGEKKGKKLIVFKYRPKKRYKVKKGHRQTYTRVEILKIETKNSSQ